jgi:hypothetical protein
VAKRVQPSGQSIYSAIFCGLSLSFEFNPSIWSASPNLLKKQSEHGVGGLACELHKNIKSIIFSKE